ncbi:MAG TPA: ATP-binding protein [Acidimicrobiales bacterium]|jgi:anti-sigma regulatory factor (Ser/Thr protein kinase)|nr:ATP-binding protein [Acidimicrobiales bacterium]
MVDESFGMLADEVRGDVALVTSELVTNAYEAGARTIDVDLWVHHGLVQVGVADTAPGEPVLADSSTEATSGRGLGIVDALGEHWEVEEATGLGKVVRCSLRLPLPLSSAWAACSCRGCACGSRTGSG